MTKIPLTLLIIQGYPESVALIYLAYSVAGVKWETKRILWMALLYIATVFVIRSLPISFGIHGIILIIVLTIYLNLIGKIDQLKALKASLISFAFLSIVEALVFKIIISITGISFEIIASNIYIRILSGYPPTFILFVIAILINGRNRKKVFERGKIGIAEKDE